MELKIIVFLSHIRKFAVWYVHPWLRVAQCGVHYAKMLSSHLENSKIKFICREEDFPHVESLLKTTSKGKYHKGWHCYIEIERSRFILIINFNLHWFPKMEEGSIEMSKADVPMDFRK